MKYIYIFLVFTFYTLHAQVISVNNGWQLKGTIEDINNSSVFNAQCVDYIWSYTNNAWQLHIANGQETNTSYENITHLSKGTGFWIKGNNNCTIDTNSNQATYLYDEFYSFNQDTFSRANWSNGYPFYSAWCPEQIVINNGFMTLNLEQKTCNNSSYASGEYRTNNTYLYGKYNVKLKASDVNGTVTSFFTYTGAAEGTQHDEIDIEILGKDTTKLQINYWKNGVEHPVMVDLGFNAAHDFHEYAFEYTQDFIKWYVDGALIYTVQSDGSNLPITPAKIIVNHWACLAESWCGKYIDGTPSSVIYDFIKFESY